MNRTAAIIAIVVAFGLGVAVGVLGVLQATGGVSEPSQDAGEVVATLSLNVEPTAVEPTAEPTAEATEDAAASTAERALFRVVTDGESVGRFYIDETLLGNRITVVGETPNVAGDVIVNFANPAASQIGQIAISARTLRTDNEFRDQAIRGRILFTNDHEFIRFAPTGVSGLDSDPVAVGETITFEIAGDLTVRDVTLPVTFTAEVTLESDETIRGTVRTTILYSDFGIRIQAPPTVSDIADEVTIEMEFLAEKVDEA